MTNIQDVLVYRGHLHLPELFEILAKYSYKLMCEQEYRAVLVRLAVSITLFLLEVWHLCDEHCLLPILLLSESDEFTGVLMGVGNE